MAIYKKEIYCCFRTHSTTYTAVFDFFKDIYRMEKIVYYILYKTIK